MDLLPKLRELSNLEVRVFVVLSIFANFKRKPLGAVDIGIKQIARECGTSPGSIRRALPSLEGIGLISLGGSPGPTKRITVIHYGVQGDPRGGSPRSTETDGAPKESATCKAPIRSEEVSEEEVTTAVAELPVKKKTRKKPSWLIWDAEKDKLVTRNGDSNGNQEFMDRWKERLGEEDIIWAEKEKAEKWLRDNPDKRINTKSFERFFGNWLNKRWEAS